MCPCTTSHCTLFLCAVILNKKGGGLAGKKIANLRLFPLRELISFCTPLFSHSSNILQENVLVASRKRAKNWPCPPDIGNVFLPHRQYFGAGVAFMFTRTTEKKTQARTGVAFFQLFGVTVNANAFGWKIAAGKIKGKKNGKCVYYTVGVWFLFYSIILTVTIKDIVDLVVWILCWRKSLVVLSKNSWVFLVLL